MSYNDDYGTDTNVWHSTGAYSPHISISNNEIAATDAEKVCEATDILSGSDSPPDACKLPAMARGDIKRLRLYVPAPEEEESIDDTMSWLEAFTKEDLAMMFNNPPSLFNGHLHNKPMLTRYKSYCLNCQGGPKIDISRGFARKRWYTVVKCLVCGWIRDTFPSRQKRVISVLDCYMCKQKALQGDGLMVEYKQRLIGEFHHEECATKNNREWRLDTMLI